MRLAVQTHLGRWLTVPIAHANMVGVLTAAVAMAIVIAFDEPDPEGGGTLLRDRVLIIAVMHALFHWLSLRALQAMVDNRVEDAEPALTVYRDPRRISHLDLAAAWFALFALAPYIAEGAAAGP